MKCHFGKHKGQDIEDIPTGYLRWAVNKIEPRLPEKYRVKEDGTRMTQAEVMEYEQKTRDFISAAEDEIAQRGES